MRNREIALACAADDRYAMPLAVTVRSAMDRLSGRGPVRLFILADGIEPVNRQKIMDSVRDKRLSVEWISPPLEPLKDLAVPSPYSRAAYQRILLPDCLPGLERVVYLDSDVIVTGDLRRLWDADLDGKSLGAVRNLNEPVMNEGLSYHAELEIPPDAPYFNSGVLLMDLRRWRERSVSRRLLDHARAFGERTRFADQDVLNAVLHGDWAPLAETWNQQTPWRSESFNREVFNRYRGRAGIVHFSGLEASSKPWHPANRDPRRPLFYRVLDKTAWKGWRPEKTEPAVRLIVITPTFERGPRRRFMRRLSRRLKGVPNLLWIVVEDGTAKDPAVERILRSSRVEHLYLSTGPTRRWGNEQRDFALSYVRDRGLEGVVYLADDDNDYDPKIFEEIRKTKKVSVFPVGNLGPRGVERPVVVDDKIAGWDAAWVERRYPVDMAGFAFHSGLLKKISGRPWAFDRYGGETEFLERLIDSEDELEPLCDGCTRCRVWHNQPLGRWEFLI